ncbi:MAG TPA: transposase [Anaerolineaceae bacterium]|nr:transposase [Anaerolineaceae bacterium]
MAKILVLSAHTEFSELLATSLAEGGAYQVFRAPNCAAAVVQLQQERINLAIADVSPDDLYLAVFYDVIESARPPCRLIVIPPDNNPNHPALRDWCPHGYLNKPYYFPDLLQMVEKLLDVSPHASAEAEPLATETLPPWLRDVNVAAQYLTRLLLESSAEAALITYHQDIWAYAGQLTQPAAQEVAGILARVWDCDADSDMARFTRLTSNGGEYLLYATALMSDLLLALVYDVTMPLSRIRSQAGHLARSLSSEQPQAIQIPSPVALVSADEAELDPAADADDDDDGELTPEMLNLELSSLLADFLPPDPDPVRIPPLLSAASSQSSAASSQSSATSSLSSVPSSMSSAQALPPAISSMQAAQSAQPPLSTPEGQTEPEVSIPMPAASEWMTENQALMELQNMTLPWDETRPNPVTMSDVSLAPAIGEEDGYSPNLEAVASTRPAGLVPLMLPENLQQWDTAAPGMSYIVYTCILLPRFPGHFLTGELSEQLAQWVPQICIAFGWHLDGLIVRPNHLQWTVRVAPVVSPGNLIRIMRQQTSHRVFMQSPHLVAENPSGDFWAPGYLVVSGSQPPGGKLVREFVRRIRRHQGFEQSG